MTTVWQLAKDLVSTIAGTVWSLSWARKLELCVGIILLMLGVARWVVNQRFPREFRELARLLAARRPSWWASHHRPSLQGWFRHAKVYVDFLDRARDEDERAISAPVGVVLRVQAPPDIAGSIAYAERHHVLKRLWRTLPDEFLSIVQAGDDLWSSLGASSDFTYEHGWARVEVAGHWDASELTAERLLQVIAGTVHLLDFIARAQRASRAREHRGERQAEGVGEAEEEVQRGDALDGAGRERPAGPVA